MDIRLIIFTDLDGTLLDHDTYSFAAAKEALEAIRARRIPLILCSSKTRMEIELWRQALDNPNPFVSENGGAIFIPEDFAGGEFRFQKSTEGYRVIELGRPYAELRHALVKMREATGLPLVGFGDLTPAEIGSLTGLPIQAAELAKQREYDEPFFVKDHRAEEVAEVLEGEAGRQGLSLTRGGRFFHLIGDNDKGKAVQILADIFTRAWGQRPRTVGIGDSLNDLPMLEAVEVPILVQKKGGDYDGRVREKIKPRLAKGIGPEGWAKAVREVLSP